MPQLPENSLKLLDISKRYGPRLLFHKLSFDLSPGIILGITGRNGSGKSTLLKIIAGVVTADAGSVNLRANGREVSDEGRPLLCGMVAPYLNVYDGLTARENLTFIAKLRSIPDANASIGEHLARVGLSGRGDDLVATYSTGLKQRMRFAAAMFSRPPLLLLDEPASNLDAVGLTMVERIIAEQTASGGLVVVATNDPREARRCDWTIELGVDS